MIKITRNDERKEREGIWRDYFGVSLRIARFRNDVMMQKIRDDMKGRRHISLDITDPKTREFLIPIIAETILVDWDNFFIKGKVIDYSVENAIQLLKNDRDCLDFVSTISMDIENYMLEDEEEIVGK